MQNFYFAWILKEQSSQQSQMQSIFTQIWVTSASEQ